MAAEDHPVAGAETPEQVLPLPLAELRIGVDRVHEYGRVAVVLGLRLRHAVDVHVDVAGQGDLVAVVYQDDLALQMASAALVDLEPELSHVKEPHGMEEDVGIRPRRPHGPDLPGRDRLVACEDLAHPDVRLVERIGLPEAVPPFVLLPHAQGAVLAGQDLVEQWTQADMVQVRMGHQNPLAHAVESGNDAPDRGQGLLAIACVPGIHEKRLPLGLQYDDVAAAGRLYDGDGRPLGDLVPAYAGIERVAFACDQQLGEPPYGVERVMRRQTLLVQVLHGHVAVDQEVPPPVLGDVHGPGYRGDE